MRQKKNKIKELKIKIFLKCICGLGYSSSKVFNLFKPVFRSRIVNTKSTGICQRNISSIT